MIRYKSAKVAGSNALESTTELLKGTQEEPKFVRALFVKEYTATENMDATIRVYLNTVLICEFYLWMWLKTFDAADQVVLPRLPLEVDLKAGDVLEVGHLSGATASNISYTAEYEIGTRR